MSPSCRGGDVGRPPMGVVGADKAVSLRCFVQMEAELATSSLAGRPGLSLNMLAPVRSVG